MGNIVTVEFRGDRLYGFESDDGVFVALKPIVESMGLDWSAQFRRVKRDPILAEGIAMMATPFGRGGDQEAVCLKLDLVNGWLFTIDTARIQDEAVREKVIVYQRECYGVLARHFAGKSGADRIPHVSPEEITPEEPVAIRRQLVTEGRQTFGLQAARELWFKLGLPTTPSMLAEQGQGELFTYTAVQKHETGSAA